MSSLRVCLVNANWECETIDGPVENLALGYLAASLRAQGFPVRVIDALVHKLKPAEVAQSILRDRGPFLLGFTSMGYRCVQRSAQVLSHLSADSNIKHVVLGGPYPSFAFRQLLQQFDGFDSILRFEGELSLVALARRIADGSCWKDLPGIAYVDRDGSIRTVEPSSPPLDLDQLPFPSRDTLEEVLSQTGKAYLLSSRGCHGRCAFCMTSQFFRQQKSLAWRPRHPGRVVDEMEELLQRGVRYIVFLDQLFVSHSPPARRRAQELAEEILSRGLSVRFSIYCRPPDADREILSSLKKAGLSSVYMGIESFQQETLDLWGKDQTIDEILKALQLIRDLDLTLQFGFIMFHPLTTLTQIRHNLDCIERYILGLKLPGAQLIERLTQGLLVFPDAPIRRILHGRGVLETVRPVPGGMLLHGMRMDHRVAIYLRALQQTLAPLVNTYQALARRARQGLERKERTVALDKAVVGLARRLLDFIQQNQVFEMPALDDLLRQLRCEVAGIAAVVELLGAAPAC